MPTQVVEQATKVGVRLHQHQEPAPRPGRRHQDRAPVALKRKRPEFPAIRPLEEPGGVPDGRRGQGRDGVVVASGAHFVGDGQAIHGCDHDCFDPGSLGQGPDHVAKVAQDRRSIEEETCWATLGTVVTEVKKNPWVDRPLDAA